MTIENPLNPEVFAESEPLPPRVMTATLAGVRVLAIDDDEDARNLLRTLLEKAQAKVTLASSVTVALELITQVRFDLVVSDISTPGEVGYTFIRHLRALSESQGGMTPAVALTAFAREEDRQRALLSGFQVHLTKPIQPSSLVAVLAALVGPRPLADAR